MRIAIDDFTTLVLTLLNEGPLPAAMRGEGETLPSLIAALAAEAALRASLELPLRTNSSLSSLSSLSRDLLPLPTEVEWLGNGGGRIRLPEDFLRLAALRMSDWRRTLHDVTEPDSPIWRRQASPFAALRGSPRQPVCAIIPSPRGAMLEFHSCRSENAAVETGYYLPAPSIDNGFLTLPQSALHHAARIAAAGVTAVTGG